MMSGRWTKRCAAPGRLPPAGAQARPGREAPPGPLVLRRLGSAAGGPARPVRAGRDRGQRGRARPPGRPFRRCRQTILPHRSPSRPASDSWWRMPTSWYTPRGPPATCCVAGFGWRLASLRSRRPKARQVPARAHGPRIWWRLSVMTLAWRRASLSSWPWPSSRGAARVAPRGATITRPGFGMRAAAVTVLASARVGDRQSG